MIFRYNVHMGRALRNDVFRWHVPRDEGPGFRDLTWDFAEPDEYPALVAKQKPGMMASKGEKAFHAAVVSADPGEMLRVAGQQPKHADTAKTIAGLLLLETDLDRGMDLLSEVVSSGSDIGKDHFLRKYLPEAGLSVVIAAGLVVHLPLQRNSIVLLLAELHQARGFSDRALALLEAAEPTTHIRLSRTELLYEAERFDAVVESTEGVINDDDFTALMLAYRGRALGELGRDNEAVSVYAQVLDSPNRADSIKAIALVGRGMINQARGELILAQNDFTQALVEVPNDEEARRHIQQLIHGTTGPS